jgi:flagellum-specific peptidoglycan hydrolase FlgJ
MQKQSLQKERKKLMKTRNFSKTTRRRRLMRNVYAKVIRCGTIVLLAMFVSSTIESNETEKEVSVSIIDTEKQSLTAGVTAAISNLLSDSNEEMEYALTAGVTTEINDLLKDSSSKEISISLSSGVSRAINVATIEATYMPDIESNDIDIVAVPYEDAIEIESVLNEEETNNIEEKTTETEESSIDKMDIDVAEKEEVIAAVEEIREIEEMITEEIEDEVEEEPEIIDYYHEKFSSSSSIKEYSGLSANQIDELLEGTDLHGIGQAVYDIEQEYEISAFFTLAVCSHESGYGSSKLAKNKNNIFGIKRKASFNSSFESFSDCVYYFGKIIHAYETKHGISMNADAINKRYCEQDDWSSQVTSLMNKYVKKANELY